MKNVSLLWILISCTECIMEIPDFRKSYVLISESNGVLLMQWQNWSSEAGFNSYINC